MNYCTMARINYNLRDLDVNKLFRENNIEEIIRIQKIIDVEIERKRSELRSMVGDRYKDILTASDAIISMKSISETIVSNIYDLNSQCKSLIEEAQTIDNKPQAIVTLEVLEERTIVMQVQLTMLLNEQIWSAISNHDFSKASQFYLLAQHIHTGLRLLKKDMIERLPILKDIKYTLDELRNKLLFMNKQKLQTINLSPEEASNNLIAMILLQTDSSLDLLHFFVDLRDDALVSITEKRQESVRTQVAAMVQSLITTVHLIHDCFLQQENSSRGLLWQKLDDIVLENSDTTLSQLIIPKSPLINYIPDIIRNFRPKCKTTNNISVSDLHKVTEEWLNCTVEIVNSGLKKYLELVVHLKGLRIVRQEALKLELPANWEKICVQINLPNTFNVWKYFFQCLISKRAHELISNKLNEILDCIQKDVKLELRNGINRDYNEGDLRKYMWSEDISDISKTENKHLGLTMKTKGYSPKIVTLCKKLNEKYLEFWKDIFYYFLGKEYETNCTHLNYNIAEMNGTNRQSDRETLEIHLRTECLQFSKKLVAFLGSIVELENDTNSKVLKSIICARFTQAIVALCPYFQKCCTFNNRNEEWEQICNAFKECSLSFWRNWMDEALKETVNDTKLLLDVTNIVNVLTMLSKWECIEIQEQTEDKVFVSQIRVPSQLSLTLHKTLTNLCDKINSMLPHTLPKQVHLRFIERNVSVILDSYVAVLDVNLNQNLSLQFLFDVKFLTMFCIPKENIELMQKSQVICDKLRSKVDPFDLDVFYSYIQNNVKQCVFQSQIIFGCLLPATAQLASLGVCERKKEEKDPIILALTVPSTTSWFPLLPVTAPAQKMAQVQQQKDNNNKVVISKTQSAKKLDAAGTIRSGAASLFGAMTTDWFS